MIKEVVAVLLVILVLSIGCGEDEPEKVITKETEEVKALPPSGMVMISKGEITIDDETISIRPFYLDKYEVTVGQFKAFLADSGYNWWVSYDNRWNDVDHYSPTDDHPMIYVTWNDAVAPKTINTVEKPKQNKTKGSKLIFFFDNNSCRDCPDTNEIYPGIRGKTQGDKKLINPAAKANIYSIISQYFSLQLKFLQLKSLTHLQDIFFLLNYIFFEKVYSL